MRIAPPPPFFLAAWDKDNSKHDELWFKKNVTNTKAAGGSGSFYQCFTSTLYHLFCSLSIIVVRFCSVFFLSASCASYLPQRRVVRTVFIFACAYFFVVVLLEIKKPTGNHPGKGEVGEA